MPELCILICTHNRLQLLRRTLLNLEEAVQPPDKKVEVLVVANACTDGTSEWLKSHATKNHGVPLRWTEEPGLGKAQALNRAIAETSADSGSWPGGHAGNDRWQFQCRINGEQFRSTFQLISVSG